VPEGIPQAFNASWTRAAMNGMCFGRLAGEALKWVSIASSFLGPGILRQALPGCNPFHAVSCAAATQRPPA